MKTWTKLLSTFCLLCCMGLLISAPQNALVAQDAAEPENGKGQIRIIQDIDGERTEINEEFNMDDLENGSLNDLMDKLKEMGIDMDLDIDFDGMPQNFMDMKIEDMEELDIDADDVKQFRFGLDLNLENLDVEQLLEKLGDMDIDINIDEEDFDGSNGNRFMMKKFYFDSEGDSNGERAFEDCFMRGQMPMNLEQKPQLGVTISQEENGSVVIDHVTKNSAADEAGLEAGDVILKLNKTDINSTSDLVEGIADLEVGDQVKIKYQRDGKNKKVKATLKEQSLAARGKWFNKDGSSCVPGPGCVPGKDCFPASGARSGKWFNKDGSSCVPGPGCVPGKDCFPAPGCCPKKEGSFFGWNEDPDKVKLGVVMDMPYEEGGHPGVLVRRVIPNSAAEKAGIQRGDIIYQIDQATINSNDDLINFMNECNIDDELRISYKRAGVAGESTAILTKPESPFQKLHGDQFEWFNKGNENGDKDVDIQIFEFPEGEDAEDFLKKFQGENFQFFEGEGAEEMLKNFQGENPFFFRGSVVIKDMDDADMEEMAKKGIDIPQTAAPELSNVSFFPNPSNGQFKLRFSSKAESLVKVRISDLSGRTVFEEELNNFSGDYERQIDISGNAKGIYLMQISQNDKVMNKKVIIQ